MRGLRVGHLGPYLAGCMLVALLAMLAASCTEEKRHRILSSLFDGVPPLGGDKSKSTRSGSSRRTRQEEDFVVYVHEPQRERKCERCHGEKMQENFSRQVELVTPVPELCYECHDDMLYLEGWVHGPVAAGDCVQCHEPHRSRNRWLLKQPIPDMCFRCHDPKEIAEIENHGQEIYVKCGLCHSGHTGKSRYLLRGDVPEPEEILELAAREADAAEADARSEEQIALEAGDRILEGRSLADMLDYVHDFVRRGRIREAKIYIKAIMQSTSFPDAQKRSIGPVLLSMQGAPQSAADEAAEPVPLPPEQVTVPAEKEQAAVPQEKGQVTAPAEKEQIAAGVEDQGQAEQAKGLSIEQAGALYMESLRAYKAGELLTAKSGFERVLYSGAIPEPVKQAIQQYLSEIDKALAR